MSEHDKDKDEQYISELYSALSNESTPEELDKKILSEARQAVDADANKASAGFKPTNKKGSFLGQWGAPVSLAAVILLSVTVVVTIEKERPYELTSDPSRSISSLQEGNKQSGKSSADSNEERQGQEQLIEKEKRLAVLSQVQKQAQKEKRTPDELAMLSGSQGVKTEATAESKKAKVKLFTATVPKDKRPEEPAGKLSRIQSRTQLAKPAPVLANPVERQRAEKLNTEPENRLKSAAKPARRISRLTAEDSSASSPEPKVESETIEFKTQATAEAASAAALIEPEAAAEKSAAIAPGSQQVIAEEVPGLSVGKSDQLRIRSFSGSRESDLDSAIPNSGVASAAFAVSEPQSTLQVQCEELASGDCLASRQCVLQRAKGYENYDIDSVYECRANQNQCEEGFSQAADSEESCIARDGCLYQEADCFCLPGEICVCEGGTPARCKLK